MATNDKFVKFLENNAAQSNKEFDPAVEIAEWQTFLDDLYRQFQVCLSAYDGAASIKWIFKDVSRSEESLGSYTVKSAVLEMGALRYVFDPVGTMLIGSKGRVDVRGPNKVGMLALVKGAGPTVTIKIKIGDAVEESTTSIGGSVPADQRSDDWKWKIVKRIGSRLEYKELSESNITDFLIDLA
ncbi:hypothetical protein [Pseudomonas rhizoryzae]|uniref:hypothetical protein n=1 Tax=Pseudomonas rhizoryzae TaxID=2571129 RepID=UPI0010C2272C|nr:hypothetical protein [Pseudomonas rhizoryzae]